MYNLKFGENLRVTSETPILIASVHHVPLYKDRAFSSHFQILPIFEMEWSNGQNVIKITTLT